jgi:hypothetical protein
MPAPVQLDGRCREEHAGMMAEDRSQGLPPHQAFEAAYRLLARHYDHERTVPLRQLLEAISWTGESPISNEAEWAAWQECVQETLRAAPLPELPPPWDG